jgi:hypothetical protein
VPCEKWNNKSVNLKSEICNCCLQLVTCNEEEEDGVEGMAARLDPSLGLQSPVGGRGFSSRIPSSLNASNSCPSLRIHHAEKAVLPFFFLLSTLAGLIFHHAPVFSGITSLDSRPFAAANSISHTPVGTVWGANKITRPDLGTTRIHPIKFFLPQVRTQLAQKIMQRAPRMPFMKSGLPYVLANPAP